jgi:hypothetical protein
VVDGIIWDAADLLGHASTMLRAAYGVIWATTSTDGPEWEGCEDAEPPGLDQVDAGLAFFFKGQPERAAVSVAMKKYPLVARSRYPLVAM